MTISVRVELGNHTLMTQMPAVPSKGDTITCSFPASRIPRVVLRVTGVFFHQPTEDYDAKVCKDPFRVVVTTEADPTNEYTVEFFDKLANGSTP